MEIKVELSAAQEKALLTAYPSIQEYAQDVLVLRANERMKEIVRDYAEGRLVLSKEEEAGLADKLAGRLIVTPESLPIEVAEIIVVRAEKPVEAVVVEPVEVPVEEEPLGP